jgi:hypothetical protein
MNINTEIVKLPELFYKEGIDGKIYPVPKELLEKRKILYHNMIIYENMINYDSILVELKKYPKVAHYWWLYSGDQRGLPTWFFDEDKEQGHGFVVDYYDDGIKERHHFDDKLEACAFFITKKIKTIITMMQDEEKNVKGRK